MATAIIIKLAFIPGDITPSSSPIADAAIIRLNRDESKKPAENAFLVPKCFLKRKEGIILIANNIIRRAKRNGISVSSNSLSADGSNFTPTIIKKTGMKNPYPIPSSLTSNNDLSL